MAIMRDKPVPLTLHASNYNNIWVTPEQVIYGSIAYDNVVQVRTKAGYWTPGSVTVLHYSDCDFIDQFYAEIPN